MKKAFTGFLTVLLVAALGAAGYFYLKTQELSKDPQAIAQDEAERLVQKVGKLILLPKDEIPTIATVTDPALLKDQPFFAKAKKGHKVLLYSGAKKAFLYDPVADKVLEVAPIVTDADGNANVSTETQVGEE